MENMAEIPAQACAMPRLEDGTMNLQELIHYAIFCSRKVPHFNHLSASLLALSTGDTIQPRINSTHQTAVVI